MTTEERFARLEKQNRQLRMGLGLLVLVVGAGFMVGQAGGVPDLVKAKAFMVVSDKGMPAVIISEADGAGVLATFNGKGQELVELGATTDGEGFVLAFDPSGRRRRGVLAPRN